MCFLNRIARQQNNKNNTTILPPLFLKETLSAPKSSPRYTPSFYFSFKTNHFVLFLHSVSLFLPGLMCLDTGSTDEEKEDGCCCNGIWNVALASPAILPNSHHHHLNKQANWLELRPPTLNSIRISVLLPAQTKWQALNTCSYCYVELSWVLEEVLLETESKINFPSSPSLVGIPLLCSHDLSRCFFCCLSVCVLNSYPLLIQRIDFREIDSNPNKGIWTDELQRQASKSGKRGHQLLTKLPKNVSIKTGREAAKPD